MRERERVGEGGGELEEGIVRKIMRSEVGCRKREKVKAGRGEWRRGWTKLRRMAKEESQ